MAQIILVDIPLNGAAHNSDLSSSMSLNFLEHVLRKTFLSIPPKAHESKVHVPAQVTVRMTLKAKLKPILHEELEHEVF